MQGVPFAAPDGELARVRSELLQLAKDIQQALPKDRTPAATVQTDPREELRQIASQLREGNKPASTPAPKVQADPRAELRQLLADLKAREPQTKPTIAATIAGNR
jgi:hypothetical protein